MTLFQQHKDLFWMCFILIGLALVLPGFGFIIGHLHVVSTGSSLELVAFSLISVGWAIWTGLAIGAGSVWALDEIEYRLCSGKRGVHFVLANKEETTEIRDWTEDDWY